MPGRSERWGVWGVISGPPNLIIAAPNKMFVGC